MDLGGGATPHPSSGKLGGPRYPRQAHERRARHRARMQSDKGRLSLQPSCGNPLWAPSIAEALAGCQPPRLHGCTNKYLLADRLNHLGMTSGNIASLAWLKWTGLHSQLVSGYHTWASTLHPKVSPKRQGALCAEHPQNSTNQTPQ